MSTPASLKTPLVLTEALGPIYYTNRLLPTTPGQRARLCSMGVSTPGSHLISPLQPKGEAAPADVLHMVMLGIQIGVKRVKPLVSLLQ